MGGGTPHFGRQIQLLSLSSLSLCSLINVLKQDSRRSSAKGKRALECRGCQHTSESFKKELPFKMNDASGPQRIKVLESRVGGMEVELSHARAQIEQIMGMMQQLLRAKLADGGDQEYKPGSTSRGYANDDSNGAGRAPREEGAAGARVCTTTATSAERRVPNHSSKSSDESRSADDTGRRPKVPAGVGPMINMQRGEARDSHL